MLEANPDNRKFLAMLCQFIHLLQDIRNSVEDGDGWWNPSSIKQSVVYFVPSCLVYFLLKEQPSVSLALPPVGWHSTVEQPAQTTTVCACENTVVIVKQPGHLTSMKNDRGAGTRVYSEKPISTLKWR